jgi:hypothetical protein
MTTFNSTEDRFCVARNSITCSSQSQFPVMFFVSWTEKDNNNRCTVRESSGKISRTSVQERTRCKKKQEANAQR